MRRAVEIAVEEGHLAAGTDASQMAFEIHAQILALHYEARFLRSPDSLRRALQAFEGIVQRFSSAAAPGLPPTPQPARLARARKPASTAARS
ncbi:hypothetical protein FQZ97_818990 [compost metagenome]